MGDVFYDWLSCKDSNVSLIIIGNGIFLTIRREKDQNNLSKEIIFGLDFFLIIYSIFSVWNNNK